MQLKQPIKQPSQMESRARHKQTIRLQYLISGVYIVPPCSTQACLALDNNIRGHSTGRSLSQMTLRAGIMNRSTATHFKLEMVNWY